jgi:hypothetical protein
MELLQWLDSASRIVLAALFALLPGALLWLTVFAVGTLFGKVRSLHVLQAVRTRIHPA